MTWVRTIAKASEAPPIADEIGAMFCARLFERHPERTSGTAFGAFRCYARLE
jgi:hypothetical protein